MTTSDATASLDEIERAFTERAIRRKELFRVLSIAGIVIAAGLALFYGWERLHDPTFAIAPRFVLIILILLNARQNLRQHKYAALLEKLTSS
jgi:hypothetical protein